MGFFALSATTDGESGATDLGRKAQYNGCLFLHFASPTVVECERAFKLKNEISYQPYQENSKYL